MAGRSPAPLITSCTRIIPFRALREAFRGFNYLSRFPFPCHGRLQALRGTRRPCLCRTPSYSVFSLSYEKCSCQGKEENECKTMSMTMEVEMEMKMEMEVEIEMEVEMEMAIEMRMQMEMVTFKAPQASGERTFHRKCFLHQMLRLWRPLGHQKATRRAPRSSRGAPTRLPRGSLEVLWELFEVHQAF